MGDVLVQNTANHVQPHKKTAPSTIIPSIENFEGVSTEAGDDYANLKKLQRQLEYIQLQEEYIKDEQRLVLSGWY
jgi:26S proteasome regulatory subunit T3